MLTLTNVNARTGDRIGLIHDLHKDMGDYQVLMSSQHHSSVKSNRSPNGGTGVTAITLVTIHDLCKLHMHTFTVEPAYVQKVQCNFSIKTKHHNLLYKYQLIFIWFVKTGGL